MLIHVALKMAGYTDDRAPAAQKNLIEEMKAIPGVDSVALINEPPLAFYGSTAFVYKDQTTDLIPANAAFPAYTFSVSPEYFTAAGTALLAGRSITWHDDLNSSRAAVVNREFARQIFGSVSEAIGGHYKRRDGTRIEVVGVVEDGRYFSLTEGTKPAMFLSLLQSPSSEAWLVVRSNRDPQLLAPAMKNALRKLDAGLPFYMQTWNKEMDGVLFAPRMATMSLGVMGAIGAMLSITGIFGMAAYSVSRRMRELGIRMALGAQRREVLQAALSRPVKLLAFGSATGLFLGMLATRVLAFIVYHATPRDPLVLAGVVLAMSLLGLLATWIPAQRVLSLDPLRLLREE
jgi:ABC-type antimicrobial peptide transport system permease subunit